MAVDLSHRSNELERTTLQICNSHSNRIIGDVGNIFCRCFVQQFDAVENGIRISKLMQVFSKQAPMMDALITHFVEQMKRRRGGENGQPPENVTEGEFALKKKSLKTLK